jgi:hypothetical protein
MDVYKVPLQQRNKQTKKVCFMIISPVILFLGIQNSTQAVNTFLYLTFVAAIINRQSHMQNRSDYNVNVETEKTKRNLT